MNKALTELTNDLLEQIAKIDAALAAKRITPESADIFRRQAAVQSEAAFDAAKAAEAGRPKTKIMGVTVPEGGLRAGALGAAGTAGVLGTQALFNRIADRPESTDPKTSYTPSIRTQADVREDVANRNLVRELGNTFIVAPTRLGQMFLNKFLENDIPLKEYYEMEDPSNSH